MFLIAFLTIGFIVVFSANQDHLWDSEADRARQLASLAQTLGLTYHGDGQCTDDLPPSNLHLGPVGRRATHWMRGVRHQREVWCSGYPTHAPEANGTVHLRFFMHHHGALPVFRLSPRPQRLRIGRAPSSFDRLYQLQDPSGRAAALFRPDVQAWLEIFQGWTIAVPDSTWMVVYHQVPLRPQDVEKTLDRVFMVASLLKVP